MSRPTVYRGRFAPSPTGPLHFGSLVSAVGSYLQAKARGGQWFVRIEDLDPPREQAGAADHILRTLEGHGLYWDGEIAYQSRREELYTDALDQLRQIDAVYCCTCSRKQILEARKTQGILVYPGTCRANTQPFNKGTYAVRLRISDDAHISFNDAVIGFYAQNLVTDVGDFVIKRADGQYAYQLAVVVDDAEQQITEVVRGSDLLDNTPRQIYLQRALLLPPLQYAHLPIVTNEKGEKLSKQTYAPAVETRHAKRNLLRALYHLGQKPERALLDVSLDSLWDWAVGNWRLERVPKVASRETPSFQF